MSSSSSTRDLELLRIIDEGVAGETGAGFFRSLVPAIAKALDVKSAFACEFSTDRRLALQFAEWDHDHLVDDPEPFEIAGTPCQLTLDGEIVAFEEDVASRFPYLADMGAESYLAIPLRTNQGEIVGHLAVIDTRPRRWRETDFGILRIFGARAGAEVERRRFELELERARRAAEQANAAKTQFLAHMSHEIRTPLNAIFGYAQLLARAGDLRSNHAQAIAQIAQSGEHLIGLVDELLDIAKIESGRGELSLEPGDLRVILDQVLGTIRLRAEQAGLGFAVVPPVSWPPLLLLDEKKLRQVMLNLLGNAVQYTDRGRVTLRIAAQPTAAGSYRLLFTVTDTGMGFDQAARERLFEPFYRGPAAQRNSQGSGLGLAIVQRLVALMGGSIAVTSSPGQGSEFVVDLLAEPAEVDSHGLMGASARIVGYRGPTRTILLADDTRDNRSILRELLSALGFKVVEAANGDEAVVLARALKPDFIFMDLVMPGLDGFEAVRRIRTMENGGSVPIVALSASAFEDSRQLSAIRGCNGFLSKPVRFDQIVDALERQLDLEWYREERTAAASAPPSAAALAELGAMREPELAQLLELARHGDIIGFGALIERLSDAGHAPPEFTRTMRAMMSRYDMQAIREYLRPYVR